VRLGAPTLVGMAIPYWQAREWAVHAGTSIEVMRLVLAGGEITTQARRRAYEWLRSHGWIHLIPKEPQQALPSNRTLASQRMRARWQDPAYRQRMVASARAQAAGRIGSCIVRKITPANLEEARAMRCAGATLGAIAEKLGVKRSTISKALRRNGK
jgi:hypothetical protein